MTSSTASLELTLLGDPVLSIDGEPRQARASIEPKRLALLAYLARPRPGTLHSRGEVVALFWPERSEEAARNALRQSLHYLRERVGEEFLAGFGRQRIGLEAATVTCDATRFETSLQQGQPAAALGLYGGEFLQGFTAADSVPLEQWIEGERGRLRQSAVEASLENARRERVRGNLEGGLHWIRRGREMAPYDERLVRAEIRVRAALGDTAEATRVFREYRARVRADLDTEPSEPTVRLAEGLQRDLPTRSLVAIRESRELLDRVREEMKRSVDLVDQMRRTVDRRES